MKRITIIIEDDGAPAWPPTRDLAKRQQLYQRLDAAQDAARRRAEYIANCSCNPANGGSGLCMCVPPGSDVWCSTTTNTTNTTGMM